MGQDSDASSPSTRDGIVQRKNQWVAGRPERGRLHHKLTLEAIEQRSSSRAREAMLAQLLQRREDSWASPSLGNASLDEHSKVA